MRIENYREQNPASNIIAFFDIYFDKMGMTLHNLKIIRSKKGNTFIAYPSYGVEDEMGQKKFFPYFSFSEERKRDFEAKVYELLSPFRTNDRN